VQYIVVCVADGGLMTAWKAMFIIFDLGLWAWVGGAFFVSLVLLWVFGIISPDRIAGSVRSFMIAFALLVSQPVDYIPERLVPRIFIGALLVYYTVINNVYTSLIYIVMMKVPKEKDIKTFEDLLEAHLPVRLMDWTQDYVNGVAISEAKEMLKNRLPGN
jgi:hypothetical protein